MPRRSSPRRSPTTSKSCFSVSTFAPHWRATAWALAVLLSAAIAAAVAPAHAADSAKVLRVAIPVAETGFDPQAAGDAYSNYVNRAIFDALYKYDYLARPFKLVPNTAAALPEISADRLTWTMRGQAGHLLCRRPGLQGPPSRAHRCRLRLRAQAHARSGDALEQQRSYEGRFVGADAIVAKAKANRQVRLRRADRRLAGHRSLYAALQAQLSRRRASVEPDRQRQRRGRARSRRSLRRRQRMDDGEPGRHRSVPAEGMASRPADRARGESRLSRGNLPGKQRSAPIAR